ncbi:MAG: mechanosensitive ion channel family protein [Lachnospiraceae bacterium]|nr:mechanosensitive ion channel family protein [Lachnospiraceae bacterium]
MIDFFARVLPDPIEAWLKELGIKGSGAAWFAVILITLLFIAIYILVFILLLKGNKKIFHNIMEKRGGSVSYQFLEKVISLVIIVYFIVIPLGGDQVARSLLGSTAVIAAVVGLAANDVIKDMLAGLQISIYKPFDVGSRVQLEDGRTGVVEKLNLRHVVLRQIDTTRLIVPNAKASTMIITNYSYGDVPRSIEMKFPIGYGSDIEKAKNIIRETICSSPLTLNEDSFKEGDPNSRTVYFLDLSDSALLIGATIYYPYDIRSEVVKDEINTQVFNALKNAGIEIPYNYVNVVMKQS